VRALPVFLIRTVLTQGILAAVGSVGQYWAMPKTTATSATAAISWPTSGKSGGDLLA